MQYGVALSTLVCIALSVTSRASEIEVRTLGASGSSGKALCERCADGDYWVDNTTWHVRYADVDVQRSENQLTFVATAPCSDERGNRL